jgi:4-hydroxy-2-oxoheptanedioate aldolase
MPRRSFRKLLGEGRRVLGTWAQIPHAEPIEILGAAGLDFAIVDLEHGHFGLERATEMLRACDAAGMAPLARVRDVSGVAPLLDAGAVAIVVPGIADAATARAAVAATRYAPQGTRGACPCVRAGGHFIEDWRAHEAGTEAGIIALVETAEGMAEIEAIASVPGLLAVMAGPFDLSVSMGLRGDWRHERVQAALQRLLAAAAAHAVPVIMPVFNADPAEGQRQLAAWEARGVRVFALGTDKIMLATAVASWLPARPSRALRGR